jgi:putative nucleotidyltransferase with HDIG domain
MPVVRGGATITRNGAPIQAILRRGPAAEGPSVPRIRLDGYGESNRPAASAVASGAGASFQGRYLGRDIEAAIRRLPPLPTTLGDLVDKLNNPDSSVKDITARIRTDPSLTTRLLRMANSAFYGSRSYITDVDRAVIVLGFRTTRNLVAAAAVASHFSSFQNIHSFGPQGMYRHSLATAVFCQMLALKAGLFSLTPEEFFVAGLLHDIGRIPLAEYYRGCQREFAAQPYDLDALRALEGELFGCDHTHVGGMVADHWKLPEIYRDLITRHHDLDGAPLGAVTAFIALADRCVNGYGIGRSAPFDTAGAVASLAPLAGVELPMIEELADDFRHELEIFLTAI